MKRITLYDDMDDDIVDFMEATYFANHEWDYLTRQGLLQHQNKLQEQKETYERRNKTFLSEERKRAWLK